MKGGALGEPLVVVEASAQCPANRGHVGRLAGKARPTAPWVLVQSTTPPTSGSSLRHSHRFTIFTQASAGSGRPRRPVATRRS